MMKIKINLNGGFLPRRSHYDDAGADCYSRENTTIEPGQTVKLDLGWSIEIPYGFTGFLMPRSSLASKGIVAIYTPIDSGYRGNVWAMLHNQSDQPYTVCVLERICQLVIVPIVPAEFVYELEGTRGNGGFGSTGI